MTACPNCGREYTEGAPFCPNCGRPLQVATAPGTSIGPAPVTGQISNPPNVATVQRPTGVTVLAALQIFGSLIMISVGLVLGVLGVPIILFGVLTLLFSLALLSGRNWARILILIGAVLDIISIVGIVWGIILLWYFTRKHVVAYFKASK